MLILNIEDRGRVRVPEDSLNLDREAAAGEPGSERTRGERERRKNGEKRPETDRGRAQNFAQYDGEK